MMIWVKLFLLSPEVYQGHLMAPEMSFCLSLSLPALNRLLLLFGNDNP